jgi:hypothetical protein
MDQTKIISVRDYFMKTNPQLVEKIKKMAAQKRSRSKSPQRKSPTRRSRSKSPQRKSPNKRRRSKSPKRKVSPRTYEGAKILSKMY